MTRFHNAMSAPTVFAHLPVIFPSDCSNTFFARLNCTPALCTRVPRDNTTACVRCWTRKNVLHCPGKSDFPYVLAWWFICRGWLRTKKRDLWLFCGVRRCGVSSTRVPACLFGCTTRRCSLYHEHYLVQRFPPCSHRPTSCSIPSLSAVRRHRLMHSLLG